MLRDEYVDHVAALVAASLVPCAPSSWGPGQIADRALAIANALADLRYPATPVASSYCGPDTEGDTE